MLVGGDEKWNWQMEQLEREGNEENSCSENESGGRRKSLMSRDFVGL